MLSLFRCPSVIHGACVLPVPLSACATDGDKMQRRLCQRLPQEILKLSDKVCMWEGLNYLFSFS